MRDMRSFTKGLPFIQQIKARGVASLTVPSGQEFYFPIFFNFSQTFHIFPHIFLILALRVGEFHTMEGPGYPLTKAHVFKMKFSYNPVRLKKTLQEAVISLGATRGTDRYSEWFLYRKIFFYYYYSKRSLLPTRNFSLRKFIILNGFRLIK